MTPSACSSSNSKAHFQAGFSLLELSLVLIILGIIGGIGLPLLTLHLQRTANLRTKEHQDYALHAIAAFVERHQRFPCPADPNVEGPGFGEEQIHCRGARAQGILPFKSLGISERYARDGRRNYMLYVVEQELAKRRTALREEPGGLISVQNIRGAPVLAAPLHGDSNPNYIALVLLSPGEGGLTEAMARSTSPEGQGFQFRENIETKDLLRWESRDQFLRHYVRSP